MPEMPHLGLLPSETVSMRERYDPVTKVWVQICTTMIAAVIDWFAVVVPVKNHPVQHPHWGWWTVATIIAALPSAGWTLGHILRRDSNGVVMWALPGLLMIVLQFVLLKWAIA